MDSSPILPLTERQREAHRSIVSHIAQHGLPPTVGELSAALGLSHNTASYSYIGSLESKGYVRRRYGVRRSLVVLRDEDGVEVDAQDESA